MNKVLLIYFVACAVLAPPLRVAPGFPAVRPETFVILFALLVGRCHVGFGDRIPKLLLAFFGIAIVAIGASYTVFGIPFNGSDLSVFPMLVQYWLVYCFGKGMSNRAGRRLVVVAVAFFVGFAALIGIAQKLNVGGVNDWLTPVYSYDNAAGEIAIQSLQRGASSARAVGTVGDPRHFACLIAFGVAACLSLLLRYGASNRMRVFAVGTLLICIAGSLSAVSRTGLMAIFIQLGIAGFLYFRKTSNLLAPIGVILVFCALFVAGYSKLAGEGKTDRLTMGVEEAVDSSGYARIRDLQEPFVKALDAPLILITGMGPAKSVLPRSEHGEIGWVTLRYGLGGLFVYGAILSLSAKRTVKGYLRVGSGTESSVAMFFLLVLSVWAFYVLAESIFKLPQIMSINMLVVGMVYGTQSEKLRRLKMSSKKQLGRKRDQSPSRVATANH